MQREQKTYRVSVEDASRRVKRHTDRCFLKMAPYIQNTQPYWSVCCSLLCYVNIMPDSKSLFQARWLVVAALASIFTAVFIPRIRSFALLTPERDYAVPQCWHKCCQFPFTLSVAWLGSCAWVLLVSFEMKSFLSFLMTYAESCKFWLFFFLQLDISFLWPISLPATNCSLTDIVCFTPTAPWWESAFHSGSVFCSWRSRFVGECALVITRHFEPSAEGGRRPTWCSLNRWVEMNNSMMSVWVPLSLPGSHCFWMQSALGVAFARSVCLFVTWPLSASTHNLAVCEIRYGCSVSALCLQPC